MSVVNFGNKTREQTVEIVEDGLNELVEEDVISIFVEWANANDYVEEAIAQLEESI